MKSFFTKKILTVALLSPLLMQYACKKVSPIATDNDQVIQTPFGLFLGNTNGMLVNTNDGYYINPIFPADGYASTAIVTSGENVLLLKDKLHLSLNNGKNFQMVYDRVEHQDWQEQIIDAPLQNRIYVASKDGKGVAYSTDKGLTWNVDNLFDPLMPGGYKINSFVAMNDGSVLGFSSEGLALLKKENADAPWTPMPIEGVYPADAGKYFIVGDGQSLMLLESTGRYNHYYSEDGGYHWVRLYMDAIPFGMKTYGAVKAPGGDWVIGTSEGLFKVELPERIYPAHNGLEIGTDVKRLTLKKNVYKNGVVKNYLFAATDKGLFRSEDRGLNWVRTTDSTLQYHYSAMY